MAESGPPPPDDAPDDTPALGGWGTWHGPPVPPAELLGGRYRLLEEIGAGASSVTYRGLDERLGRQVAVKLLREQYTIDPMFMRRFEREARAAAAVSHPYVVAVHDYGEHRNRPYIVMDYIDGENLKDHLARVGPLPEADAVRIARQIVAGLGAVHRAGIIHRDIKPQNILLGRDGIARLADFGIVHLSADTGLTTTGTTLGTAAYMAPEQAQGGPLRPATDLYAVGVVLYEMLTGRVPFEAPSSVAVIYAHVHARPVPPSQRAPDRTISPALDALVMRAMAKRPEDRFADTDAMRDALAAISVPVADGAQDTQPLAVADPAPWLAAWPSASPAPSMTQAATVQSEPLSPARGYRRDLSVVLAVLALLLIGGGGAGAWFLAHDRGDDPATRQPADVAIGTMTGTGTLPATVRGGTQQPQTPPAGPSNAAGMGATRTVEPTVTPTTAPVTPLAISTSTPTLAPTPTEAAPTTVPATETGTSMGNGRLGAPGEATTAVGSDGDVLAVIDQQGVTQVIEPVNGGAAPTDQAAAGGATETAEMTFSAWDWQGAYFQESGNLQPWAALYAQSTGYGAGSLTFTVAGQPASDTFVLTVEGMTSESWGAVPIEIRVNGQAVYTDASPFPIWNGIDGQQPWTTVRFELPAALLRPGENTITFQNMVGEGGFSLPPYILLADTTVTVDLTSAGSGAGS